MATDLSIPIEVARDIQDSMLRAELAAIADFPQTSKDEDSIVESFGTHLRCRNRVVEVGSNRRELTGAWTWSISHSRIRGRGPGAPEKKIGADLVVELKVRTGGRYRVEGKSLLIQAKKNWTRDSKVFAQAALLSTWREAASVINLTAGGFEAFNLDDVIAAQGQRPSSFTELSQFLTREFVLGELGDETLIFDARRETLQWQDMRGVLVKCSFSSKQKISINVTVPDGQGPWTNPAAIKPEEITEHRLKATPRQVLGVGRSSDVAEFKKAYRRRQKIYHTDKHPNTTVIVNSALKHKSQEINHAYAELTKDD